MSNKGGDGDGIIGGVTLIPVDSKLCDEYRKSMVERIDAGNSLLEQKLKTLEAKFITSIALSTTIISVVMWLLRGGT